MEETAQYFEKRFFINRSQIFIALPKFYATHWNYEMGGIKWGVPNVQATSNPVAPFYSIPSYWSALMLICSNQLPSAPGAVQSPLSPHKIQLPQQRQTLAEKLKSAISKSPKTFGSSSSSAAKKGQQPKAAARLVLLSFFFICLPIKAVFFFNLV